MTVKRKNISPKINIKPDEMCDLLRKSSRKVKKKAHRKSSRKVKKKARRKSSRKVKKKARRKSSRKVKKKARRKSSRKVKKKARRKSSRKVKPKRNKSKNARRKSRNSFHMQAAKEREMRRIVVSAGAHQQRQLTEEEKEWVRDALPQASLEAERENYFRRIAKKRSPKAFLRDWYHETADLKLASLKKIAKQKKHELSYAVRYGNSDREVVAKSLDFATTQKKVEMAEAAKKKAFVSTLKDEKWW